MTLVGKEITAELMASTGPDAALVYRRACWPNRAVVMTRLSSFTVIDSALIRIAMVGPPFGWVVRKPVINRAQPKKAISSRTRSSGRSSAR